MQQLLAAHWPILTWASKLSPPELFCSLPVPSWGCLLDPVHSVRSNYEMSWPHQHSDLVPSKPQGSALCAIILVLNMDSYKWFVRIGGWTGLGYVSALSAGIFGAQIFLFNKIVPKKMTRHKWLWRWGEDEKAPIPDWSSSAVAPPCIPQQHSCQGMAFCLLSRLVPHPQPLFPLCSQQELIFQLWKSHQLNFTPKLIKIFSR